MNKEFLHMQKLAGIITESEYKAKLNEEKDFGYYFRIYSNTIKTDGPEAALQAVMDSLPEDGDDKMKYAQMVARTYKTNQPDFTGEGEKKYWNGWTLGYAEDSILFIHPANDSRPWIDGRVIDDVVTLSAEKKDGKRVEQFLQDLGNQLNATPYDGEYNNIELEVNEQALQ